MVRSSSDLCQVHQLASLGHRFLQFNLDLTSPEFKEIAFIGVIFLLFTVGLEINIRDLKKTRKTGFFVGIFGITIPFIIGYTVGMLFNMSTLQCAVIGTIFLATSTTMAIRILSDMDLLSTRVGLALYTVLVINDVIAMIIFALVFSSGNSLIVLLQVAFFFLFTIVVGFLIIAYTKKKKVNTKSTNDYSYHGISHLFYFCIVSGEYGYYCNNRCFHRWSFYR